MKKISNIRGHKRVKTPILNKGDILTQDYGYTIKTKIGTLYRRLPKNYKLKGKVIKKIETQYQGKKAFKYTLERISKSPNDKRLRKRYKVWQWKDGTLMK